MAGEILAAPFRGDGAGAQNRSDQGGVNLLEEETGLRNLEREGLRYTLEV